MEFDIFVIAPRRNVKIMRVKKKRWMHTVKDFTFHRRMEGIWINCTLKSPEIIICNGTEYKEAEPHLNIHDKMFWIYIGIYCALVLFAGKYIRWLCLLSRLHVLKYVSYKITVPSCAGMFVSLGVVYVGKCGNFSNHQMISK